MTLILSLFPGLGLLDEGFTRAGFTVVRGPDVIWGGRIESFHPRDWLDYQPWTTAAKRKLLGNAVPVPMAMALARAIRKSLDISNAAP